MVIAAFVLSFISLLLFITATAAGIYKKACFKDIQISEVFLMVHRFVTI